MLLLGALVLPGLSWRIAWLVAAAASAAVLAALLLRTLNRPELAGVTLVRQPVLTEMVEVATGGGPIAMALCFAAYSSCWFAIVGFLPTLQVEGLGFATATAAVVTAVVAVVNVFGNLAGGWLLQRGVPRVAVIVGTSLSMALCASGIFLDALPDFVRLLLAGFYSAAIGTIPAALFTAIPVHVRRPQLVGAATGLLMQGSNVGALLGPPIIALLVSAGGWPAAAWLTSVALAIVAGSGVFLHRRERRNVIA
jgi:predicted MFS family arabinose efflux permease